MGCLRGVADTICVSVQHMIVPSLLELTLGRSSVKGLKRVSKGSARIWNVSMCISLRVCSCTYYCLERILAIFFAGFALVLGFLVFWRHVNAGGCLMDKPIQSRCCGLGKKLAESRPAVMIPYRYEKPHVLCETEPLSPRTCR